MDPYISSIFPVFSPTETKAINEGVKIDGDFSKLKTDELKNMKDEGCLPNYKSMFGDKEIELINEMYKDDINLYKSHFGKNDLLF